MQGYVPDKDHLAVVFLEAHLQVPDGILFQPGKEHLVGLRNPAGRTPQALAVRVLPMASNISFTARSMRSLSMRRSPVLV